MKTESPDYRETHFTWCYAALFAVMLALVVVIVMCSGCQTTRQQAEYNTLYSLEKTTTAAFDGYVQLIVDKKVNADYLPAVSSHYNKFQAAMTLALDAVQHDQNAVAPPYLAQESADLINLINLAKGAH